MCGGTLVVRPEELVYMQLHFGTTEKLCSILSLSAHQYTVRLRHSTPTFPKSWTPRPKLAVCRPTLTKPYSESVYIYFYVEQLVSTKVESSKKESGVFVFA